jgi:TetR/AcrR family transcriptional regulator, regulator of mycofactocin system
VYLLPPDGKLADLTAPMWHAPRSLCEAASVPAADRSAATAIRTLPVENAWDRRRRLVALDIEAIALELFAESGFDAVTVDQIARAAGISESTFFRYFPTKEDVLFAMPRRVAMRICDEVDARPDGESVLESWRAVIVGGGYSSDEDRRASEQIHRIIQRSPIVGARIGADAVSSQRHLDTIARRLGTTEVDLRANVLAAALRGALSAASVAWYAEPGRDVETLMTEALDLLEVIGDLGR